MTPRAEISVPWGVSEGLPPMKPDKISPSSLASFLNEQSPSLRLGRKPNYFQIFARLSTLPYQKQEELLVSFYSEQVEGFPNPEKLGKFLVRVNNIPWFRPLAKPEISSLEEHSGEYSSRLNLPLLPVKIIEDSWSMARIVAWGVTHFAIRGAAWDAAGRAARNAAQDTARRAAWDAAGRAAWDAAGGMSAWDAAQDAFRHAAGDAGQHASWGASWITVEDLMPKKGYPKNPFEPLMEIYKLGCWPIGTRGNEKEFVIFVPPVQKAA